MMQPRCQGLSSSRSRGREEERFPGNEIGYNVVWKYTSHTAEPRTRLESGQLKRRVTFLRS